MAKEKLINSDRWCAVGGLAFCGLVYGLLLDIDKSVRTFPLSVTCIMFVCFAVLLRASTKPTARRETVWVDFQAVGVVVFAALYLALMPVLGYTLCTGIFCLGTALMLGYKRYLTAVIASASFSVGLYLLFFRILGVPLPRLGIGIL